MHYPDWWFERGVIGLKADADLTDGYQYPDDYLKPSDYSPILQGQLLHFAEMGFRELDEQLAPIGGANFDLRDLLRGGAFSFENARAPVSLGQLKSISSRFYELFYELNYTPPVSLSATKVDGTMSNTAVYPWEVNTGEDNLALALLGQAKYVFSWEIATWALIDAEEGGLGDVGDGLPDWWEAYWGLDTGAQTDDASGDGDQDGLNNLEEFQNATNPSDRDSDGDGTFDQTEVNEAARDALKPDHPDLQLCLF
jgi:hypothetical protein